MQREILTEDERELISLKVELATIEEWNRLFGHEDLNDDSRLARERRRCELLLKIAPFLEREKCL